MHKLPDRTGYKEIRIDGGRGRGGVVGTRRWMKGGRKEKVDLFGSIAAVVGAIDIQ